MSGSARLILILLAVVFGSYLVIKTVLLVVGIVSKVIAFLIPALVIAAIAVILYAVVSRKALGPGGRRILP